MHIKQIVYSSQAVRAFTEADLAALLEHAQASNLRAGITGVLLHTTGRFVQCIEGPSDAIDDLYERINADSRHADVLTLQETVLPQACFEQWTMGCALVTQAEFLRLNSATWERASSDKSQTIWQSPGFVLMRSLWESYKEAGKQHGLSNA